MDLFFFYSDTLSCNTFRTVPTSNLTVIIFVTRFMQFSYSTYIWIKPINERHNIIQKTIRLRLFLIQLYGQWTLDYNSIKSRPLVMKLDCQIYITLGIDIIILLLFFFMHYYGTVVYYMMYKTSVKKSNHFILFFKHMIKYVASC